MKIKKNNVVGIYYTLKNDNGEELDKTHDGEPMFYIHGMGHIIEGLEKALEGKYPGDAFLIALPPDDAYGPYQDLLVHDIKKEQFDDVDEFELGMQFEVDIETDAGPQLVFAEVIGIEDDTIKIDMNHSLAGQTLNFEVEVQSVRNATDKEINTGEVQFFE